MAYHQIMICCILHICCDKWRCSLIYQAVPCALSFSSPASLCNGIYGFSHVQKHLISSSKFHKLCNHHVLQFPVMRLNFEINFGVEQDVFEDQLFSHFLTDLLCSEVSFKYHSLKTGVFHCKQCRLLSH